MKRIFKLNIKKIIASLTATSLLISFVVGPTAASALNNNKNEEYKQIFKEFILPYSYGKITNAHYAGTDRVIINIQDLHCHPKVQKNIANIIETFDKKFGVQKIYLEGAYGDVSTKWIADKTNNNKNVIEQMLETGRLTGAEYYSALSGKTDLIKGLEEKEPYLDNIKRLGKILQDQENIDLILKSLHDCTEKVKKQYYTKRQYKLEKLFKQYKEGKIESQKYYTLLSKHIDKLGIDLTKYENSLIYLTLLELQKDLNYKQITRELQELVSVLKQQLPYNAYKSLLENTENFKEVEKLYSYIVQLDKTCNLNISSNFKELDKYFRYVELSKKINPVELVKEDEFLIQEINTRFAQTKAQQDVVFLMYFEKYLKDYLTTKITLDDYKYYQENINRYIQVYNKYVDNRVLSLLNEYIEETDKFYNINLDRNTYFTKNIFVENEFLNQIENTSSAQDDINKIIDNMQQVKELDIVVTGGFHSQTVTELLKNQNVSYIVITPNVTDGIKLAEDTYYELAKEQSKIAFQTIAPIIASISPKLQAALLEKIGNVNQEEISKIVSLDEAERTKVISELIAANLLESDDIGAVEEKLQEIVEDIVGEEITSEVLSKIKNLQKLLKNKEELQKVIYSLNKGQVKQAGILVSDIFAKLYDTFASFVSSINEIFSKQEKEPTDFYDDENFDNDIDKEEDMDSMGEEEIYDDDLDLWFSDVDIINLSREIIKVGQNNKDIKDFIWYLGKYNMADYELLNKILDELKTLNDDSKRIQEYCGIIYALTDKNTINAKEKAAKTKENIMSFFEKPKSVQLKFCDLFSKLFVGHDYMKDNFFNALLDFVNKNEYTDTDFDFLLKVCKYSNLISELGTKENIYNFLILDIEKRKLLYAFYQAPKSHTNININRLTLNFILSVLNKYDFIGEQFDYIMNLICSVNITNDSVDQKYVESLKEKEINMSVLENFKYIDIYNRYLLDLLFSDVDELNVAVFVSEMQTMVNLFDDLQYYKIDTLETENKGFALAIFLNDGFEKYCRDNNVIDLVKQYQLAIRVSRKIYSILGDNIFTTPIEKMDDIIKETLDYYNKIDRIIAFLTLFTNKTAIFSLHNNERNFDRKSFRFTPAGIKEILKRLEIEPEVFETIEISFMDKVLDFIKTIKQDEIDKQLLIDFVNNLDGSVIIKKDILEYLSKKKDNTISKKTINRYINRLKITERFVEVNHFLSYIEHFNDYGQEKGVFIFDGHGSDDGIFYTDNSKLTVNQISQALIKAHNNGVNLENLTLMFSSCHSYKFADNIINELINNGISTFPQIITDAGKETVYGYTTTVKLEGEQTKVSNVFYSLMKYLDSQTPEQLQQMKGRLTFKDLADAPRYLSNNTVFVTNQQVSELNRQLERNIRNIIEGNDTEETEDKNYFGNEDNMNVSSYNLYAQLQLPFTQKILNKIGNIGIIKAIYKTKSGNNFRFTKLGVAIGVLFETISFWMPNFVKSHNFDPSMQTKMTAVVWVIRALSIGIGFGVGSIWALLLTETITHYIWNRLAILSGKKNLLLQTSQQFQKDSVIAPLFNQIVGKQKTNIFVDILDFFKVFFSKDKKLRIKFDEENESPIVILIKKEGINYSLMLLPGSGSIYVQSIGEKSFRKEDSNYTTKESIEEFLGVSLKISKHRFVIKDKNSKTDLSFVKYKDLGKIVDSLEKKPISKPEQKEIDLLKSDSGCRDVEYIYLDQANDINRDKIANAIKEHKLIILYPLSNAYDVNNLTDEQICALYLQVLTKFTNMVDSLFPKDALPRLREKDFKGMEHLFFELIKNAFIHGNLGDTSKPIYVDCEKEKFTVYNAYNDSESTSENLLIVSAMARLSGTRTGMGIIQQYADEKLITVTPQQRRIRQIGYNENDKYYAVTIEKTKSKQEQVKDITQYLRINGVTITQARFEEVIEYLKTNNYEITDQTYEYIRYLLYVSHIDYVDMRYFNSKLVSSFFDLSNSSKDFIYNFIKQNEKALKGNQEIFDILINITKDYDSGKLTEQNFKEILNLVILLADRIGKGTRRDVHLTEIIKNNKVSDFFLQYYLENKDTFNNEGYLTLIAYLVFSGVMGLEYYANQLYKGDLSFDGELKELLSDMVEHQIYDLNMFYNGLTLKIYFNQVFKDLLEKEYDKNGNELTPLIRYRTALVIAENLATLLGEKINSLTEADINKIIEKCVQDIISKKGILKQRFMFSEETAFEGDDTDTTETTLKEGTDFVVNRDKASNTAVVGLSNSELMEGNLRRFSLDGIKRILSDMEISPRLLMDLEVTGEQDAETKINKMLKMIEEYPLLKNKYGLKNLTVVINGHGDDFNVYMNGSRYVVTRTDLARALFKAYKNGANLEEITLDLSCCASYAFCENLFDILKDFETNNNLEIKLPNIITEAGKEIKPGFTVGVKFHKTNQIIYLGNSTLAILIHIRDKFKKGKVIPKYLTLDDVFDSEIYNSNHTIFISGQDIAKTNAAFKEKLIELLGQDLVKDDKTKQDLSMAQLQLPFTQKILNKIGNIGIIKSIYKERAGNKFRFTKLGVAIGVLFETISFWMPNFVKSHNFDPSIQTKMTAVVWVIRALSIGLGFGVGSIWALLLTETIAHYVWNRLAILSGKKNLLLQTSENLTKKQKIQKMFEISKMETDFEEDDEEKQEINSLLNKEQISETDIEFVIQKEDFFVNDSLYNYYKLKFFFSVIDVLRKNNIDIDNDVYEQIILLMTLFTYEQATFIPGEEPYKIVNQLDEGDTEQKVLRFFNLKTESRQQIYDKLKGGETLGAFELMIDAVEQCEQSNCSIQEIDDLLTLINDSREYMEEYYFKGLRNKFLNINFLKFYSKQKNKGPGISDLTNIRAFTEKKQVVNKVLSKPLWLSLMYSNINISSLLGNNEQKFYELLNLINSLDKLKIRMLDTEYGGLTLKIFLNKNFRASLAKQYKLEGEAEGKEKEPTIFNKYRIAQKISRTLYEVMGDNVFMLSEQDLNAIMETMVKDNARKRAVAKQINIVSENTGTVAIHNMEQDKYGSRRFTLKGIEKIMDALNITPKLVTDFVVDDEKDTKNKADMWLESIENFLELLETNGLTNIRYVFDGHGNANGLYLTGDGLDIANDHMDVKDVSQALFKAYRNCVEQGKEDEFESLILDLSCCSSYEFAKNVISELKRLEEQAGLPLKFPQIITEAGKETEIGYSATYRTERFLLSNMEAALIVYIHELALKGEIPSSITLQDLFDANIYMSNHTIFISSSEIEELNKKLKEDLSKILRDGFVPEDTEIEQGEDDYLPTRVSELQLPFTQKVLNKIGNTGIIKSIYKEKAGENFRFTKLGVAIGVLFETISFWMPNFVKSHNFDPSIQTKMTAVVWVIRALSIGLGFGLGSIWALLLTETIAHFIWNISVTSVGRNELLLQTPKEREDKQENSYTKIDFDSLIERVFGIIDSIEKINNSDSKNRAKSMTEAEQILIDTFTPEELEIIDLLASTIFDSIKYVNSTRNTSAVEFVNIIYSLQNGLFNYNLLMTDEDLKQHILNTLKHYVEVSIQKKGTENILAKAVKDNKNLLNDMADFLTDIIVKNNLMEKSKQLREQRKQNMSKFIEGVRKDDSAYSVIMVCSANENRSAIWHIMFEDFLKRTKRKMAKVLSAGVFYDISQEELMKKGKTKDLRDDYIKTLSSDERYKGIDESIKSGFRSRYIEYLRLPKSRQNVFIVAGEQHRAQLIKLGYDPNWIFLMSEFYSDGFKADFKQSHESLGRELEENNIFSMSEFPDPFEEQILRQDLPEFVRSLVDYVFKTRDDVIRETLPERFVKFTDDYNQFEHMDNLPSFAFTDDERRDAARQFYEEEISDLIKEKHQFEFAANTKYLYILQNRRNKEALLNILFRSDTELKFKLFALMYLSSIGREITQQEQNAINVEKEKMLVELRKQLETNSFKILNNFDLRAYMMGIYLMLQNEPLKTNIPRIIYNAFIINEGDGVLAREDGFFARIDLFTVIHELTHVMVSKPSFYNKLTIKTVNELVSYITPNMFLSMVKLSLKAYSQLQSSYTIYQTNGLIDYVKVGKKLQMLYNLFSDRVGNRDLKQEEHSASIAFLDLLFNAHSKIGKNVDWAELLETIKTMEDEHLDQSFMFWTIATEYTEILVAKGKLSQEEAKNLLKEMEKMQLWTMLSFDIIQNIKATDFETYNKILGTRNVDSFEEQLLSKPAETKEQLKIVTNAIKSKEQLSRNDILTLLIIDVISNVDYEQLINNFEGIIEGIINTTRITAQTFNMQKGTYSLSEYEQISKYVTNNYTVTQNSNISIVGNIFDFIASSLDQLFFAKLLINQIFGTKNLNSIMKDKKLLIVTSKQQEKILQQVLKNNDVEDVEIVTMEIRTEPVTDMRSDMVLDVQRGIKARYDNKENKLIVYSKQGINITTEEIQSLIMQEYFAERNEDIVTEDVIAFASATDATLDDITNRLKTAYTASVTMANKETKFDLSLRKIANFIATCNQEFKSTGIKTFVIIDKQTKQFASEIKSLQEQGFRFIISCKSDNVVDITEYDGLLIDATEIRNLNQAINFMKSIKKKVLTQGVAKQISIKFNDNIYEQFEHLGIDIFNNFGIMPVMNADKIRKIGRYEVEKVTENNIEQLLRSNNVAGLVIDNARVFVGKKSIIKQIFSKEHKYNKGYNASLSSKFDYICYDVPVLADLLNIDINNGKDLNKLRNIDLSKLNLSSDSLTYLEYLQKKGNYEEMTGFIRGIAMNTARTQIINALKEKGIELDIEQFAKEANGKYQKAFLTIAVQLMMENIDITKYLETDFIDSDMTTKQYLDSVFEKVNINIEDILKQNEYKIEKIAKEDIPRTIEDFKNYVVLLDNLKIVKETTANFDMSVKAVRSMLAAA